MGGLNAAAKRTAFADLSNTSKNKITSTQIYTKNGIQNENIANGVSGGTGKDAFRRPAQRPAKPLAPLGNNYKPAPSTREFAVRSNVEQGFAAGPKKNTMMVYNDMPRIQGCDENHDTIKPLGLTANVPAIRRYKSQPQLKTAPPVLRRTQSRLLGGASVELQEEALATMGELSEALYEDALEHIVDHENDKEQVLDLKSATLSTDAAVADLLHVPAVAPAALLDEEKQPATSATVLSEPGEYWDEEVEEEIYDDQGYTTAHSFRSRGELTTSGVTTLPYPKVTSRTITELEAAKAIVEATRLTYDLAEDAGDLSMVADYSEDIFQYMRELEVCSCIPLSVSNVEHWSSPPSQEEER